MTDKIYGYTASGGGATGAWGGGVSEFLINDLGRKYKYLSGTSTGALLMNMVGSRDMSTAKLAYTSVTNDDIYKLSPYKVIENKNGVFETKLNYWNIAWNILIRKQNTFGDSTKLRDTLIPKFFTQKAFDHILMSDIELIACVTNITKGCTEYKSNKDNAYEDFLDWIFASSCATPFMSIVEKDRCEYIDGGFIEHIPIQILIDRGCTEIDVVDLKSPHIDIVKVRNPLHLIGRMVDVMMWESATADLHLAKLKATEQDVILNIYNPGRKLTNNSLIFNKQQMSDWWDEGYEGAKAGTIKETYLLRKGRKRKLITDL